jgi:hypothetical protein
MGLAENDDVIEALAVLRPATGRERRDFDALSANPQALERLGRPPT